MLAPDPGSRLADGVVIETTLRARVLGVPALRIEGTIAVAPASLAEPRPAEVVRRPAEPTGTPAVPARRRDVDPSAGSALAEAARLVAESRRRLEA